MFQFRFTFFFGRILKNVQFQVFDDSIRQEGRTGEDTPTGSDWEPKNRLTWWWLVNDIVVTSYSIRCFIVFFSLNLQNEQHSVLNTWN